MLRKYKRSLNVEFRRLYRHLVFGGVFILLASIIIFQILKSQHDSIIEKSNVSVATDLGVVLALKGDNLFLQTATDTSGFAKIYELSPLSEEDILSILRSKKVDAADLSTRLSFNNTPINITNLITKESDINRIYIRFFESPFLSQSFKTQILSEVCCLNISEYSGDHTATHVSHTFIAGFGHGFLWPLNENKALFVRLNYNADYAFFFVLIIVFLVILAMLVIALRELILLNRRLTLRGGSLSAGSGVLKELADSADPMSSHIQRLLKVQREMINAISHELRTPIARLRFGLEVVKDEVLDADLMTISALEDDIEELNSLVDEVLTYGKLEEGSLNLHFEKVNMQRLIDGILDHNSLLLSHLSIRVYCAQSEEDSIVVMADVHHLHRALQNLILNASKYANSAVDISFKQNDESWQIDIEDDGPGIKLEDREKIFIPFHRLDDSRTRASGGYGLGLAIVQRIAFWHGGSVTVGETKNGGAKFTLIWSRGYHKQLDHKIS